jgi:hypothetical protein
LEWAPEPTFEISKKCSAAYCPPFDPKKEEAQAAQMADRFYAVALSQNEEIALRDPRCIQRFLIELICKEHFNPDFYAYHLKSLACDVAVSAELKLYGNQISARDIGFQDAEIISRDSVSTNLGDGETVSCGCRFWRLP